MNWKETAERELRWAVEAQKLGNHGKARTCSRRAVGIAATTLQDIDGSYDLGMDFMRQVRTIAEDSRFADTTREAAQRLQARLSPDFTAASQDPVGDAMTIIEDLLPRIDAASKRRTT